MGRIGIAVGALVALVVALIAATAPAQEADGIRWEPDLRTARATAAETGRPLMVVFR